MMSGEPDNFDWGGPDIHRMMMISRRVWFRELLSFARRELPSWNLVCDVGCGSTGLLEMVWKKGEATEEMPVMGVGIDANANVVSQAQHSAVRNRFPLIFMKAKIESLMWNSPMRFDVVFCHELLNLLGHSALGRALEVLHEMLSPGGVLVASNLSSRSKRDALLDPVFDCNRRILAPSQFYNRTDNDYLRRLTENGFRVECRRMRFTPSQYAAAFGGEPSKWTGFPNEKSRRAYYTEYGKAVWLCRP
jgi:SAM-dependent methyltransferase